MIMNRLDIYRNLHVGDIISIYDIPYRITRLDIDHIATRSNTDAWKLVFWAYDEVKRISITESWCSQLNMLIVDKTDEAKHLTSGTLAYSREEETIVLYNPTQDDIIYFDDEYIDEVQQKYYKMYGKLPDIILSQNDWRKDE